MNKRKVRSNQLGTHSNRTKSQPQPKPAQIQAQQIKPKTVFKIKTNSTQIIHNTTSSHISSDQHQNKNTNQHQHQIK